MAGKIFATLVKKSFQPEYLWELTLKHFLALRMLLYHPVFIAYIIKVHFSFCSLSLCHIFLQESACR